MKTIKMIFLTAFLSFFIFPLFGAANAAIYVRTAPPAKKVVVKPAKPYKNAVWVSGHWGVKGGNYVWISGHWTKHRHGCVWVDGYWKKTPKGWVWVKGHWARI